MTRHEQLTKKIALLRDTAMKCADYGSSFYEVWFRKFHELRDLRDGLSLEEAGRIV